MNDINKMPPKCQYCPYWEVCKYPWVCPDIGDKEPKRTEKRTETHASDLIDRAEAIDAIEKHIRIAEEPYQLTDVDKVMNHAFEIAASCVYNLSAAQPERKRGRWNCSDDMYESAVCSVCGWDTTEPWDHIRHWFNYCPNCGADMREVDDERPD